MVELLWRKFNNRRQLCVCVGLVPEPCDSGQSQIDQGISKHGKPTGTHPARPDGLVLAAIAARQCVGAMVQRAYARQRTQSPRTASLFDGPVIHMDETVVQLLKERDRSPTSQSYYMWIHTGGPPKRPVVVFDSRVVLSCSNVTHLHGTVAGEIVAPLQEREGRIRHGKAWIVRFDWDVQ